jgi:hypothetical protein
MRKHPPMRAMRDARALHEALFAGLWEAWVSRLLTRPASFQHNGG